MLLVPISLSIAFTPLSKPSWLSRIFFKEESSDFFKVKVSATSFISFSRDDSLVSLSASDDIKLFISSVILEWFSLTIPISSLISEIFFSISSSSKLSFSFSSPSDFILRFKSSTLISPSWIIFLVVLISVISSTILFFCASIKSSFEDTSFFKHSKFFSFSESSAFLPASALLSSSF